MTCFIRTVNWNEQFVFPACCWTTKTIASWQWWKKKPWGINVRQILKMDGANKHLDHAPVQCLSSPSWNSYFCCSTRRSKYKLLLSVYCSDTHVNLLSNILSGIFVEAQIIIFWLYIWQPSSSLGQFPSSLFHPLLFSFSPNSLPPHILLTPESVFCVPWFSFVFEVHRSLYALRRPDFSIFLHANSLHPDFISFLSFTSSHCIHCLPPLASRHPEIVTQ